MIVQEKEIMTWTVKCEKLEKKLCETEKLYVERINILLAELEKMNHSLAQGYNIFIFTFFI